MAGCLFLLLVLSLLLLSGFFVRFLILIPGSFSTGVFIVLLYIPIDDLGSLPSPTGELCSLTPSAISLSQVINERDD